MLVAEHDISVLVPFLACPKDHAEVRLDHNELICTVCAQHYQVIDGIPVFLTAEDEAGREDRGTQLFETHAGYFERLHTKRVNEWKKAPYLSETFSAKDSWTLDIGSGSGTLVLQNALRGIQAMGMDISIHGARFGRDTARRMGLENCYFVVGDACRLPFRSDRFQLVTNYTTIEHVYDHESCLKEMHRVTVRGGRVLVNTINNLSLRPENGWFNAIGKLLFEFKDYLLSVLRGRPVDLPHGASPREINYCRWQSGDDVDLYHARSYDLLYKASKLMPIEKYTSYSYPTQGQDYFLTPEIAIEPRPLSPLRRLAYAVATRFDHLPVLKHMGRTITVIGRKA